MSNARQSPPAPAPAPAADSPGTAPMVAMRHPQDWPLAFGPYRTGGVIHQVDAATAEFYRRKGFELVSPADAQPPAPAAATAPATLAPDLQPVTPPEE